MRSLLLLLPILTGLVLLPACSCGESETDDPTPDVSYEPEVPTPPPAPSGEDLMASLVQEPVPEGARGEGKGKDNAPARAKATLVITPTASVQSTDEADDKPPIAAAPTGATMAITEATIARQIVDRKPVGDGPFPDGSEVACFTRIDNPDGTLRHISHVWFHEGTQKSSVKLAVRAASWRTWSKRPVYGAGNWRVDVVDEAGAVLKSLEFVVE